jgi:hypothetical protein
LRKVTTYVPAAPRRGTRNQQQQQESFNHLKNGHTKQKATCKNNLKKGKKKPPNKQTEPNRTKPALQQRKTDKNQAEKRRERHTEKEWRTGKGVRAKAGTRNDGGVDSPAGRQAHGIRLSADPR